MKLRMGRREPEPRLSRLLTPLLGQPLLTRVRSRWLGWRQRGLAEEEPPTLDELRPTADEHRWWEEQCRPLRRRVIALSGAPMPIFGLASVIAASPTAFLAGRWILVVPVALVFWFLAGLSAWNAANDAQFAIALAGKRVRDALLSDDPAPPALPEGEHGPGRRRRPARWARRGDGEEPRRS
jgi:hypothetical protein